MPLESCVRCMGMGVQTGTRCRLWRGHSGACLIPTGEACAGEARGAVQPPPAPEPDIVPLDRAGWDTLWRGSEAASAECRARAAARGRQ